MFLFWIVCWYYCEDWVEKNMVNLGERYEVVICKLINIVSEIKNLLKILLDDGWLGYRVYVFN